MPSRPHGAVAAGEEVAVTQAMVQMEVDLLVLTAVLHFSGGAANPFFLFYVFHVIIATIILPRNLSFAVGLTAIALFGLLAADELNARGDARAIIPCSFRPAADSGGTPCTGWRLLWLLPAR